MPANIKEIDTRIRSVKNTQQITRAMKMVAAAKLRRTQDKLIAGRPYAGKLTELLGALTTGAVEHPFFATPAVERRLVIVVSSDKGLCGSYNSAVIRRAQEFLDGNSDGVENVLITLGRKAGVYFRRRKWEILERNDELGGTIAYEPIHRVADRAMQMFLDGEIQEVVVVYTRFVSTLTSVPETFTLLPLAAPEGEADQGGATKDYIYEPSADEVLKILLPKSVRSRAVNAVAESFTSEHGARMTSMDSASKNAGDLIDKLTLFRNRARQAAITQEISEIVGGADAIS